VRRAEEEAVRKSQEEAKRTKEAADLEIAAAEARQKEIEKQMEREREMARQREKGIQKERKAHKEAARLLAEAKEKEDRAEGMREEMERIRQENERMRQEANEGGAWASVGKVRHSSCGQSPLFSSSQLGKEISGSAEKVCYG
jgi:predicted ribosome quality control (RQC) complex YloA/Tae2 family protein